jgi:hypothetical protein
MTTTPIKSTFNQMLADALGAGEHFSDEHVEILLLIGQGMFWSDEFNIAARKLADKVRKEFKYCGQNTIPENSIPKSVRERQEFLDNFNVN